MRLLWEKLKKPWRFNGAWLKVTLFDKWMWIIWSCLSSGAVYHYRGDFGGVNEYLKPKSKSLKSIAAWIQLHKTSTILLKSILKNWLENCQNSSIYIVTNTLYWGYKSILAMSFQVFFCLSFYRLAGSTYMLVMICDISTRTPLQFYESFLYCRWHIHGEQSPCNPARKHHLEGHSDWRGTFSVLDNCQNCVLSSSSLFRELTMKIKMECNWFQWDEQWVHKL
jgi:hypothetical protein